MIQFFPRFFLDSVGVEETHGSLSMGIAYPWNRAVYKLVELCTVAQEA
jgi:hypothetical protein